MAYSRPAYTGPVKNRGVDDQGRALVSREELADFRRKYGADKTLRDLLNADRTGRTPSSASDMRARGPQEASTAPSGRAEIPTGGTAKAPASTGEGGMSDTTRNVLNTLGALGMGAGAGMGARALMKRAAAQKAAAEGAWRNKPPAGADPAKWKEIVQQIDEAYPAGKAPGYAKGGKVKAYAKGGSVKGSGCEQRGLRKCKVY